MSNIHLDAMRQRHHYPLLRAEKIDAFSQANTHSILFLAGDPARFPEANDVAMILPELISALDADIQAALIAPEHLRDVQQRYRCTICPSLVFLRAGAYLGVISHVQNWLDYLEQSQRLLANSPKPDPGDDTQPLTVQ
ncbi:MAG: hypothetical protein OIF35_05400 [Cellvibrionaceae bacterium]|nr:hypothetical protein [Cellvibrionaceae bacterium]